MAKPSLPQFEAQYDQYKQRQLVDELNRWVDRVESSLGSTGGGGGGTGVHNDLTGRDAPDAHPISSIAGLQTQIASLSSAISANSAQIAVNTTLINNKTLASLNDVNLTLQSAGDLLVNVDGTNWEDTAGRLRWDVLSGALIIRDSSLSDQVSLSHDGTDFNFALTNTTDVNFTGLSRLDISGGIRAQSPVEDTTTPMILLDTLTDNVDRRFIQFREFQSDGFYLWGDWSPFTPDNRMVWGSDKPSAIERIFEFGERGEFAFHSGLIDYNAAGEGTGTLSLRGVKELVVGDGGNVSTSTDNVRLDLEAASNADVTLGFWEDPLFNPGRDFGFSFVYDGAANFSFLRAHNNSSVGVPVIGIPRVGTSISFFNGDITMDTSGNPTFTILNSANTDSIAISHDGTDVNYVYVNTLDVNYGVLSGVGAHVFASPVHITNTTDAALDTARAAFTIGSLTGENIVIDGNEIMARNNGVASPLFVQFNGGDIRFGGAGDTSIFIDERASAAADIAAQGQIWVRDDAPNVLLFTDDAGTDFLLSEQSGSFTVTMSGMTAATTGTVLWRRVGNTVFMYTDSAITGTSNSVLMEFQGVPVDIRPTANKIVACVFTDNGNDVVGYIDIANANDATCEVFDASSFTNSGIKGLPNGWSASYNLA